MAPLSIDDFGPLPVRRPVSVPEFADLIREAVAAGQGVYPFGGGTALGIGLPPIKPGVAADTRGLAGVIDYPARDMTITVRTGITIQELQNVLAVEGQRLPVDVPSPAEATLGGALAVNMSGPRRLGRGTFRDYVIGIGVLADDGAEISGGGRVVKNVAGYDLMKLHVGAVGTLGVVTRVTLKVTPKPEDQALVAFGLTAASVGPTLDRLAVSNSRPAALELLNGPAARAGLASASETLPTTDPWVIVAGFEEKAATVAWQVAALKDELKTAPVRDVTEYRGAACGPLWSAVTELQNHYQARLTWKATVLPSRTARFAADAASLDHDMLVHAHAGSGVVFGHVGSAELTLERASAMLTGLAAQTADANGSVSVRRCPPEWKRSLPVWGRATGDRVVMRAVKKALDPNNVFNPGRLFGDV